MSRSEVKCPKCGQEVQVYGVVLEKHKVYTKKKNTGPWKWCPQKTVN